MILIYKDICIYMLHIIFINIYIKHSVYIYFPGNLPRKDSLPTPFPSVPYA